MVIPFYYSSIAIYIHIGMQHFIEPRQKVRRRKPSIGDGRLFGRVPVGERKAYYVPAVPMSYILS